MGLFDEQISRKPDNYPWAKELIKQMHNGHWTVHKFDFNSDLHDFKVNANNEIREIITKTLSAVSQIEVAVKKFWGKLGDNLPQPAMVDLGYVMANIEVIHNEAYEKLLEVLDLNHVFEENLKNPIIAGRVNYLRKYLTKVYDNNKKQYVYAIILFTLFVENVSLFSQFYIINWLFRYKRLFKDTSQQTDYTLREEDSHFKAGARIINTIKQEYPELFDKDLENKIYEEARVALECEEKVVDWILGDFKDERISAYTVKQFVRYKLNEGLVAIGYKAIFEIDPVAERDFEWFIEQYTGVTHTDTFFKHATEYAKSSQPFNEDCLW